MGTIGSKVKKSNLPTDTFFGQTVNTITGSTAPSGTPSTGTAYVWFDAGLRKWRAKYDNATIESLGVGTSGAAAHKDTHKSGGSDPFAKGDDLDASAKYLQDIADPSSDSQRLWLVDGGSEIRYWDDQGSPVKQTLATLGTSQTFSNKILNSTCDLTGAFGAASVAFTNVANIFTQEQTIKEDASPLLTLFRDTNTIGSGLDLFLDAKSSTGVQRTYAYVNARINDNTNTLEDGALVGGVLTNGAFKDLFWFDDSGIYLGNLGNLRIRLNESNLTAEREYSFPDVATRLAGVAAANLFTATQDISIDDDTTLSLTRPVNTTNAEWGLEFWARDSGSVAQEYAEINAKLIDNTAASEDGELGFYAFKNGTLTKGLTLNGDGLLTPVLQGMKWTKTATKTGNYTMLATDAVVPCDATGGGFTVTLPAAATAGSGTVYTVVRIDVLSSTAFVSVDGNGSETIDGITTWRLFAGEKLCVISDGSNWLVVNAPEPAILNYYQLKGTSDSRKWVGCLAGVNEALLTSTTSPSANLAYAMPFIVPKVTKYDTIGCEVTTADASDNLRVGLYYDNGNVYPGDLIFQSGDLSTGTTGTKEATITSTLQTLQPGLYWLVFVTSATALQIRIVPGAGSCLPVRGQGTAFNTTPPGYAITVAHTFGSLPNPFTGAGTWITTASSVSNPIPAVGLRAL